VIAVVVSLVLGSIPLIGRLISMVVFYFSFIILTVISLNGLNVEVLKENLGKSADFP
jgi:hypothetical protein